jgi:hypothetical protein
MRAPPIWNPNVKHKQSNFRSLLFGPIKFQTETGKHTKRSLFSFLLTLLSFRWKNEQKSDVRHLWHRSYIYTYIYIFIYIQIWKCGYLWQWGGYD